MHIFEGLGAQSISPVDVSPGNCYRHVLRRATSLVLRTVIIFALNLGVSNAYIPFVSGKLIKNSIIHADFVLNPPPNYRR